MIDYEHIKEITDELDELAEKGASIFFQNSFPNVIEQITAAKDFLEQANTDYYINERGNGI